MAGEILWSTYAKFLLAGRIERSPNAYCNSYRLAEFSGPSMLYSDWLAEFCGLPMLEFDWRDLVFALPLLDSVWRTAWFMSSTNIEFGLVYCIIALVIRV